MIPVPSKLVLTKKPLDDDEIEISEGTGAAQVADIMNKACKARVRLVACGNYEQGMKQQDPDKSRSGHD